MRGVGKLSLVLILLLIPFFGIAQSVDKVAERRAELERQLAEYEAEIARLNTFKEAKAQERQSLERDVALIDAEIKRAELSIKARDIEIERLNRDIGTKETRIGELDSKMDRQRESLAKLLRRTNEIDDYSLAEIILSNNNLSDFFEEVDTYDSITSALDQSFDEIVVTRNDTEEEKVVLLDRRSAEEELRGIQELERQKIAARRAERKKILDETKGVEAAYQELIRKNQKTAAEIRAELFKLRGSAAIPFGEALGYAEEASRVTGVRPAFVLGILAQESNLGENVGQCLLTNEPNKGDGKGVNTGRYFAGVMKPTRDVDPYMAITEELGINPFGQVVSCPPSYGYGGAMGPAQFIPSTWILYKGRIAKASGQNPPNPWDPRTAFIASALLLSDNGADLGGYSNERLAALRYFAGWKNATNSAYSFYGDGVMELAEKYQGLIDTLNNQ